MIKFFLGLEFSKIAAKMFKLEIIMIVVAVFSVMVVVVDNKKAKKIIAIFCIILTVFMIVIYTKGIYNILTLKQYPKCYYFGQEKDENANGNGRIFDNSGNIIYQGEFSQSVYHGEGKEYAYYLDDTTGKEKTFLEYEGEFYLGLRSGQGKLYNKYGEIL